MTRLILRFVAGCPGCGAHIPADQVMCSNCARK